MIGFSNMTYVQPKGMPSLDNVHDSLYPERKIGPQEPQELPSSISNIPRQEGTAAKKPFPWWLLIIAGTIIYDNY